MMIILNTTFEIPESNCTTFKNNAPLLRHQKPIFNFLKVVQFDPGIQKVVFNKYHLKYKDTVSKNIGGKITILI